MKSLLSLTVGWLCLSAIQMPADLTPSPTSTTQPLAAPVQATNANTSAPDSAPLVDDKAKEEAKSLLPTFDPKSETVAWDGGSWKVENNRLFRSQFVKYLNDPEETDKNSTDYEALLAQIQLLLNPGQATDSNVDQAWKLLFEAAKFGADSQLCNDIADAVYASWQCKSEQNHLATANASIRSEEEKLAWNMEQSVSQDDLFAAPTGTDDAARSAMADQELQREIRLKPDQDRLAALEAESTANSVKLEASELQAKIQFQTMIVQMFFQRRFEHVVIACEFYQAIFGDGDQKLLLGEQIKSMLTSSSGIDPTIAVISALTHEAIQNVNDGVDAYLFMMGKGELDGATERLQEAYAMGQNLPRIKTLPRSQKELGYEYTQKSNTLSDALDVKDYATAQTLVDDLQKMSTDFNPTKPLAAIQTAQVISRMHLAKAKAAASQNDEKTLETELGAAAEKTPLTYNLKADLVYAAISEIACPGGRVMTLCQKLDPAGNHTLTWSDKNLLPMTLTWNSSTGKMLSDDRYNYTITEVSPDCTWPRMTRKNKSNDHVESYYFDQMRGITDEVLPDGTSRHIEMVQAPGSNYKMVRLIRDTNNGVSRIIVRRAFDDDGRLLQEDMELIPGKMQVKQYAYDAEGRLTSYFFNGKELVRNVYDDVTGQVKERILPQLKVDLSFTSLPNGTIRETTRRPGESVAAIQTLDQNKWSHLQANFTSTP